MGARPPAVAGRRAQRSVAAALIILAGLALQVRGQDAQQPPAPPTAAQQIAPQATPATANAAVGSVATVTGNATDFRNGAPVTALKAGDAIFKGDLLQTDASGSLAVTFDDDTTFKLGPSATLEVSDFLFEEGGSKNAATFNVVRGTAAFVASLVAKTGDMKIATPTATLGIRGTTGLVDVPQGAGREVSIKLYPDANGTIGRIEVFGAGGAQLGTLSRGATGFSIRPGAAGRFAAVPLPIPAQQAARDRAFVQQTFAAQRVGRQLVIQRRGPQQPNPQRQPNLQRQPAGRASPTGRGRPIGKVNQTGPDSRTNRTNPVGRVSRTCNPADQDNKARRLGQADRDSLASRPDRQVSRHGQACRVSKTRKVSRTPRVNRTPKASQACKVNQTNNSSWERRGGRRRKSRYCQSRRGRKRTTSVRAGRDWEEQSPARHHPQ